MQKNLKNINMLIIFILGITLMSQESITEEKWYIPVDIGQHIDINYAKEEQLNKDQVREIFIKDKIFQQKALHKFVNLKDKWFKNNGTEYIKKFENNKIFYLNRNNHPISANVYRFSKSKAKIYIQFIYGHSRWHHYHIVLKNYIIDRDSYINEIFNLIELEKKYSFVFKGVGYGTSLDKALEILGNKYYEYAGPSPQFQNIYYEEYNIELVIQDWIVKYLQQGRPGWMNTEMKHKNFK